MIKIISPIFTVFCVFYGLHTVAQGKDTLRSDNLKKSFIYNDYNLPSSIMFIPERSNSRFLSDSKDGLLNPSRFFSFTKQTSVLSNFTFIQKKRELVLPNFGEQYYFGNRLGFDTHPTLDIHVEFGLVKQNTVMSAFTPNYRFVFHTTLEYELTPWLSSYVYGQYVSPSLNQKKFFDPLQFMNPLFMQTEAGGGIRSKYKNIKTDVGVRIIQDTQVKGINPAGIVNSKMTIGL